MKILFFLFLYIYAPEGDNRLLNYVLEDQARFQLVIKNSIERFVEIMTVVEQSYKGLKCFDSTDLMIMAFEECSFTLVESLEDNDLIPHLEEYLTKEFISLDHKNFLEIFKVKFKILDFYKESVKRILDRSEIISESCNIFLDIVKFFSSNLDEESFLKKIQVATVEEAFAKIDFTLQTSLLTIAAQEVSEEDR